MKTGASYNTKLVTFIREETGIFTAKQQVPRIPDKAHLEVYLRARP